MTGFLKRDLYLTRGNMLFYLLIVAAFILISLFTELNSSFVAVYLVVFAMSCVMGLFSYDDMNRWQAYGAATSAGRRAMVNARYLLIILLALVVAGIQLLLLWADRVTESLPLMAVYSGTFLLYASLTIPVCYHFGGTKARTVMVVAVAVMAALVGMGGTILNVSSNHSRLSLPPVILFLPLIGGAALFLSWHISLSIMAKKEL